jgi:hypothetical protein
VSGSGTTGPTGVVGPTGPAGGGGGGSGGTGPTGAPGITADGILDGGDPFSVYTGEPVIDCGSV